MAAADAAGAVKVQPRLKAKYNNEIKKALQDEFGYENVMQIPRPGQGRRQHRCR